MADDAVSLLEEMVVSNVGVEDEVVEISEEDEDEPPTLEDTVSGDVVTCEGLVERSAKAETSGNIPKVEEVVLVVLVVLSSEDVVKTVVAGSV